MNINWKEELNLEGANVLNNIVEKDGQIIHEQQVNRDKEPNEDKLSSKESRRLSTLGYDYFLWVDINESQNVK
jgi:hypothetical protein